MLIYKDDGKLMYSGEDFTGDRVSIDGFRAAASPAGLICALGNWRLDQESFIEKYKAKVKMLAKNPRSFEKTLSEFGYKPIRTLGDIIFVSLSLALYESYDFFTAWSMHAYLVKEIGLNDYPRGLHGEEGIEFILSGVELSILFAATQATSWAKDIIEYSQNGMYSGIVADPSALELVKSQNIQIRVYPTQNGIMPFVEIKSGDMLSLMLYIYSSFLESNQKLSKCKNCQRLFIPTVRKEEVYCTHIHPNGKTCKELGYENTLDGVDLAYRKAYKTENAYMNRIIKTRTPACGKQMRKRFRDWVNEAQAGKIRVENGEMSEYEYTAFLEAKEWRGDNG